MASSAVCHPSPSLSPSPILSSSKLTASPRSTFPSLSFHYRKTCSFLSVRHVPIRDVASRAAKVEEEEGGGGGNVSVVDKFIARRKKGDDDDEERVKGPAYTPPTNPKVGKALYPRKKDRMRSKRFLEVQKLREEKREYDVKSAIMFLKQMASTKFVESAEAHFRLRLDPKYSDQQLRATVNLPKGTGQKIRIAVIAQGDKLDEAEKAGADIFGGDELINKIKDEGFMDFDKLIAVPEMMPKVASLGRLLGPRGLMPNPKAGTVAADITQAINEFKKGKVEYRLDKAGSVHVIFGKVDFSEQDLMENFMTIVRSIEVNKPKGAKGVYWRSAYVCSTMGPSIRLNTKQMVDFQVPQAE